MNLQCQFDKNGGIFLFATPKSKALQMLHSLQVKSYSRRRNMLHFINLYPNLGFFGSTDWILVYAE
jgi:hypothetical protein